MIDGHFNCMQCRFLFDDCARLHALLMLLRPKDNRSTGIVCVRGAGQAMAAWRVRGHPVP